MASSYFILAQTQAAAAALELWRNQLSGVTEEKPADNHQVVVWQDTLDLDGITKAYAELSSCIEVAAAQARQSARGRLVVMVDKVQPTALDVCAESGWEALIATLILTFPEVKWVFGCATAVNTENDISWDSVFSYCSLPSLLEPDDGCPHFDSSGLRAWVRQYTNEGTLKNESLRLGIRSKTCAAIDDEASFAHFHAYTAYRFGLRAEAITTWKLMKHRFGVDDGKPHGFWLLLEDMSLKFADCKAGVKLHKLGRLQQNATKAEKKKDTREDNLCKLNSTNPLIENSEYRFLITSGQTDDQGKEDLGINKEYLKQKYHVEALTKQRKEKYSKNSNEKLDEPVVLKPVSGMFDLWSKIGLMKESNGRGYVAEFLPYRDGGASDKSGGHGAPGRLGLIASKLVKRATIINEHVLSVEDAVLGAVLATDALELIGCRAPTTAFDALSLKHQLEVIAECKFSGIEYNIEFKRRLIEIENDITFIFKKTDSKQSVKDNVQMILLTRLVRIFREHGQFDEEQQCMRQVRKLNNSLWLNQQSCLTWLICVVPLRYVELLLSSFFTFVGWIVFWLILIGAGFMCFEFISSSYNWFLCGLQDSVSSFFSMGAPFRADTFCKSDLKVSGLYALLSSFTIFLGALHLGIFISYVYSLIARK